MLDILSTLPAREGHFLLESGYHTDLWLTLDAIFVDPAAIAPLVDALAAKLRPYEPTAICGSLLGGAFLAQSLAGAMHARFYFTEPASTASSGGLFTAEYRLPPALARHIHRERVAVVDDVISAGSSARATVAAVRKAGASIAVVASLLVLGNDGAAHFAAERTPMETLARRAFNLWKPADCPLCQAGRAIERP